MASITYGVSTNETTFYYGISSSLDTPPTTVTQLHRINSIGGAAVTPENIDASALEDGETHNIKGRSSTDDSREVAVNITNETIVEWGKVITDFNAMSEGQYMWFETIDPGITQADWFVGEPPSILPSPERGQNELLTMAINLTLVKLHGRAPKVLPST